MRKICFNDKIFNLTEAVLKGQKTIVVIPKSTTNCRSRFRINENVAVAQSYNDIYLKCLANGQESEARIWKACHSHRAAWLNKSLVQSETMPHIIKITNYRVEKLQNISDDDCLKAGVIKKGKKAIYNDKGEIKYIDCYSVNGVGVFNTPHEAFVCLICSVKGKKLWKANPLVYIYEFKCIK